MSIKLLNLNDVFDLPLLNKEELAVDFIYYTCFSKFTK